MSKRLGERESKSIKELWELVEKEAIKDRIEKRLQKLAALEASIIQEQAELERELKNLEEK